jgi:hypothetical protein
VVLGRCRRESRRAHINKDRRTNSEIRTEGGTRARRRARIFFRRPKKALDSPARRP